MQDTVQQNTISFSLTEDQELLRKTIRDIAEENFKEKAKEIDKTHKFPRENFELLASLGMCGLTLSEKYGGADMGYISYSILIEELARCCATTAVIMSVQISLCGIPIEHFGSETLKEKYLKGLASGKLMGAFCLSEPGNGSDAQAMLTKVEDNGDHYLLNGTKAWITNGGEADVYIITAQSIPVKELEEKGLPKHKGVSAFIVEKDFQGVSFGKLEDKLGIRASATCQVILNNVKVPKENLLGKEGEGFKIALSTLDGGRIGIASQGIGIAQACYDLANKYAKERDAFGQKIINFQAIQFMLTELATKIEAGRLLIYQAANKHDSGRNFSKEAAEAKLFCSELASEAGNICIQILGGYGYTTEYEAERYLRDAKITEIYEGTSEIQRLVIAQNVFKEISQNQSL